MNQHILEKLQIVSGFVPLDLQTARTGDYVNLAKYGRCAIVFFAAAGTAGDDPVISLRQATDVADAGGKALNFDRIDVKQGADLTAIGTFTQIANTDSDYTEATAAEAQKIWVIDIKAEDLDIDNGYCCLRAAIADTGSNAQLGTILYLLHEPRYQSAPLPSAIV